MASDARPATPNGEDSRGRQRPAPAPIDECLRRALEAMSRHGAARLHARIDATANTSDLDRLSVDTTRTLSLDAVQVASSGHPGTPMALGRASTHSGSATCAATRRIRFGRTATASYSPFAVCRSPRPVAGLDSPPT